MMRIVLRLLAVVAVVAGVSGCSRKQPPAVPQPDDTPTRPTPAQPDQPAPRPTTNPGTDAEEIRRLTAILEQVVHFDYDESTIRADAQQQLAAKVPVLRSYPTIRIRIEGHADERGSVEYNLALGMRRANAVRDYLADFGIDASRFETVSFGEDRPVAMGESEAAWSQNRRAEFRVSGLNR